VAVAALQQNWIINDLNSKIRQKNRLWLAGDTSVSRLPFVEKQKLIGSADFEESIFYYKGGYYTPLQEEDAVEDINDGIAKGVGPQPTHFVFDWRNRHGKNFMTPVKSQMGCWVVDHLEYNWTYDPCIWAGYEWRACGSCWAHGSLGAFEANINLYYNQLLNQDFSEQQLLSCFPGLSCNSGGYPSEAFTYIETDGVLQESCFPFVGQDTTCTPLCPDYLTNRWTLSSYSTYQGGLIGDYGIKNLVQTKGPLTITYTPWQHVMVIAGFGEVTPGVYWPGLLNLSTNSSYLGKNYWIMKNSWGADWGEEGYGKFVSFNSPGFLAYIVDAPETPIPPILNSTRPPQVFCQDIDTDGYCWWGIGETKPSTCPPSCRNTTDSDCNDTNRLVLSCPKDYVCGSYPFLLSGEENSQHGDYRLEDPLRGRCCGDNRYEYPISSPTTSRCCDNKNDFIDTAGFCRRNGTYCNDSDGGINPLMFGYVTGVAEYGGSYNYSDYCDYANPSTVWEYSCHGATYANAQPLTCPAGLSCSARACANVSNVSSVNISSCFDTDGGINVSVRGTVFGNFSANNFTDFCLGQNVNEYYCFENASANISLPCPEQMHCVNGACSNESSSNQSSCSDTDGGFNISMQGTVFGNYGNYSNSTPFNFTDFCTENNLTEYYCTGFLPANSSFACPNQSGICSNGACYNQT
jgi:hypothetical protein